MDCRWYKEMGHGRCDGCGRLAREHEGVEVLRRGAGPFGEGGWEHLTWAEFEARIQHDQEVEAARKKIAALPDETLLSLASLLRET